MTQVYTYMCMCPVALVRLTAILQTVARRAPLSMEFSRQEYWSELPCPSPGDLPNPGIEPVSPSLQADSLSLSHGGSPIHIHIRIHIHTHTHTHTHIHIHLLFFRFSPHIGYYRILSGVACGQYFLDPVRRGMTHGSPEWGLLKQCYSKFGPGPGALAS